MDGHVTARRRVRVGIFVLALVSTSCGGSTVKPTPGQESQQHGRLMSVCDSTAQIGSDINSDKTGKSVTNQDLETHLGTLRDSAAAYGEPFLTKYETLRQTATTRDESALRAALADMTATCKGLGYSR